MRREKNRIKPSERKATLEALFKAADRVKGEKAVETFINEILTESEQITIGRRILIANLILQGYKQSEIHNLLGVSPNTFSRIRQWLGGHFPDYNQTIKKTTTTSEDKETKQKRIRAFSLAHIQKKFPMHSLLFTLSKETISNLKNKK